MMCEMDEESAYGEVLTKLVDKPVLIGYLDECWRANVQIPHSSPVNLSRYSKWLMRIEGWWYLVWRTCDAIGAQLIVRFFKTKWLLNEVAPTNAGDPPTYQPMTQAQRDTLLATRKPEVAIREEFVKFMRSQNEWDKQSYGSLAAGDIGPWPKPPPSGS
jgi:hypothetical protein